MIVNYFDEWNDDSLYFKMVLSVHLLFNNCNLCDLLYVITVNYFFLVRYIALQKFIAIIQILITLASVLSTSS